MPMRLKGVGREGVRHVGAWPALTGTFNLNMKGSDVPTLSAVPCSSESTAAPTAAAGRGGPSCFSCLTFQPSRIIL